MHGYLGFAISKKEIQINRCVFMALLERVFLFHQLTLAFPASFFSY